MYISKLNQVNQLITNYWPLTHWLTLTWEFNRVWKDTCPFPWAAWYPSAQGRPRRSSTWPATSGIIKQKLAKAELNNQMTELEICFVTNPLWVMKGNFSGRLLQVITRAYSLWNVVIARVKSLTVWNLHHSPALVFVRSSNPIKERNN